MSLPTPQPSAALQQRFEERKRRRQRATRLSQSMLLLGLAFVLNGFVQRAAGPGLQPGGPQWAQRGPALHEGVQHGVQQGMQRALQPLHANPQRPAAVQATLSLPAPR